MTDQPTPETDDFRPCHLTPSDWPAFARALERERNAARAERDELNRQLSVALKGKRPYSSEFADETIAAQVKRIAELEEKLNGWFSERDALRADVARLRDVLQRIVSNGGSATNVMLFDARTALAK
jgi:phage shock protein A